MTRRGRSDAPRPEIMCLVAGCGEAASARKPICDAHWKKLPPRTRSNLSLSAAFPGSPTHREVFARAAARLKAQA